MEHIAQLRQEYPAWRRSSEEEFVNAVTHGMGLLISIAGSVVMMSAVLGSRNAAMVLGCGMYLVSLMAVYAASTLSHSPTSFRARLLFRQLDQAFIYLLIAGTYTPFALAYLHGWYWNVLMVAMWAVAFSGFIAKVFFAHQVHAVPVSSYLFLGWMPIVAFPSLYFASPAGAFQAIVAGGMFYMLGTYFLLRDDKVRHYHAIWHLCVMAGSACHFLGIYVYAVGGGM
jgi:hemolysin III